MALIDDKNYIPCPAPGVLLEKLVGPERALTCLPADVIYNVSYKKAGFLSCLSHVHRKKMASYLSALVHCSSGQHLVAAVWAHLDAGRLPEASLFPVVLGALRSALALPQLKGLAACSPANPAQQPLQARSSQSAQQSTNSDEAHHCVQQAGAAEKFKH
eukprot:1139922-Pelagomonas_calceolata.AAC.4